jgi:WD40 repeat protein
MTGDLVGTLRYMSPEQALAKRVLVDQRTDIYSLGVTLYELMTLEVAFPGQDRQELLRQIAFEEPKAPRRINKAIPAELETIVLKALEKNPADRYATAQDLAGDLERFLKDEPIRARRPTLWHKAKKWARRNRPVVWTAGLALAVLLVLAAVAAIVEAGRMTREKEAAKKAEDKARRQLYRALVEEARGIRLSRRLGQRFRTLEILKKAKQLAQELKLPPEHLAELRNEAIACLALTDVRLVRRPLKGFSPAGGWVDFDGTLERYARVDSPNGVVTVRRVADDQEIARLPGKGWSSPHLSRDGRYLMVGQGAGVLKVWKLNGSKPAVALHVKDGVRYSIFSPDSRQCAASHADGSVSVYDLGSRKETCRLGTGAMANGLAYRPGGTQLAVSRGAYVHIHDLKTGNIVTNLVLPSSATPQDVAWHPRGRTLAVAYTDMRIYLWNVEKPRVALVLQEPRNGGIRLAFNHGGDLLAATGWDGRLRLWDARTAQQLFSTPCEWGGIPRFSPDDRLLAPAVIDGALGVWEVAGREYRTLIRDPLLGKPVNYAQCAISPKHPLLAVGMRDGFGLWDLTSGRPLKFLAIGFAEQVLFEPSGSLLINNFRGGTLRFPIQADATVPGLLHVGPGQRLALPGSYMPMACSRDGRVLANAHGLGGGWVWHRDRPDPPIHLPHEDSRSITVSLDGHWVATASHGASLEVKIWDLARGGKLAKKLRVGSGGAVGFSPDGKWLASTGGGLRLWKVPSWDLGPRIGGRGTFAFSPDGQLLAVETGSGTVRLVDPATDREYARLEDPNQEQASFLTFSPDGSQLVANGEGNWVHVWDLRAIRQQLVPLGLDWEMPAYPPVGAKRAAPVEVIDLGELLERGDVHARQGQWDKALADFSQAVKLASNEGNIQNPPGAAPHRAEDWKAAIAALAKSMKLRNGGLCDWLFLAMAHWQLGEKQEAREWYGRAVDWMAKNKPHNEDWRRFRAEAEELLGIKKK